MRIVEPDVLMAQGAASPEYEVTATFETRGRGPFDRAVGNFGLLATNLPGGNGGVVAGKWLDWYREKLAGMVNGAGVVTWGNIGL